MEIDGLTTIRIESNGEQYRATQRGVDVAGRGETAQLAVRNYAEAVHYAMHEPTEKD